MNPNSKELILSFLVNDIGAANSPDELPTDVNLFAEGLLDSIGIMRLIAHIESTHGFKIPARDLVPRNFMTIDAMVDYLKNSVAPTSEARSPAP